MQPNLTRRPPPIPGDSTEDAGLTRVILALAGIMALVVVLAIGFLSNGTGTGDGAGGTGSATTGAGPGNASGGDNDADGKGDSGDGPGASTPAESESNGAGGDENTAESGDVSQGEESNSVPLAGDADVNEVQVLPLGVEIQQPKSNRKVRNTFNPFGNSAPREQARGTTDSQQEGKKADFFGVEAEGHSFVYVVDKSSSMTGPKFEAARQELIESIDDLKPNQKFFVIFFDSVYYTQETKGMVRAIFRNKKEVKDWMMDAVPSGGTEPYDAIEFALSLRPDAVFVLSDGEFNPFVVDQVKLINAKFTISINTINFTTHAQTLQDLAEQNRGKYRFVP